MTAPLPADPTGRQFSLRLPDGRVSAQIAQVGASLRSLNVDGVDLITPYPAGLPTPSASGITLVPWPNRVRDGRWTQRGRTHQLSISEPRTGNASHGLLRFTAYEASSQTDAALTLAATVFPQTGYPFQLDTSVTYTVTPDGLDAAHTLTNVGVDAAPVALGVHPYLCLGDVKTADLVISVPAETWFEVDEQLIPVAEHGVGPDTDLREGRRLGDLTIDRAYGALQRDPDGTALVALTAPDGRRLVLRLGEEFAYVQVFTTDKYPGRDLAVAVEPMSAPADAFNSGAGLRWLEPGESWTAHWGLEIDHTSAVREAL